jgi:SH3-like domain-containing protein
VVVGYKRLQQLAEADECEVAAMVQWRYVRDADGEHHWVEKEPPARSAAVSFGNSPTRLSSAIEGAMQRAQRRAATLQC